MGIIVLDKCFLQAASWEAISALAREHALIITGSLFHELMSDDPEARARAFSKLPRQNNPAHLLDNVSALLAHEEDTHTPVLNILDHTIRIVYRFNPQLRNPDYSLPPDAEGALADNVALTRRLVDRYIARTNVVVQMFQTVAQGSDQSRASALSEIEKELADPANVLTFYRSIEDPELPPAELLTPAWTTFRFFQTALLFSLHTIHRHRGVIPQGISDREYERLEHDVHDHMVLCTATLAGGLATNETKLKRWFKLLCPSGLLVCTC